MKVGGYLSTFLTTLLVLNITLTVSDEDDDYMYQYLFDLAADPYEANNLFTTSSRIDDDKADTSTAMITALSNFRKKIYVEGVPVVVDEDAFVECGGVCPFSDNDDGAADFDYDVVYEIENPPNIVVIMTSFWGYNDIGAQSDSVTWTTPSIDGLIKNGVQLSSYFSHMESVPSRGAFLTGKYSARLGMDSSVYRNETYELPLGEITLAQELKTAGYSTYAVGKWSVGMSTEGHMPTSRGFDYFYGHLTKSINYYTKEQTLGFLDLYENDELVTDNDELEESYHTTYLFQTKMETKLSQHLNSRKTQSSPFFMYYALSMMDGQSGYDLPPKYNERCDDPNDHDISDDVKRDDTWYFCGMNIMLDEVIGNTTCFLETAGVANNTVLIIIGDGGADKKVEGRNYPYHGYQNQPFRGGLSTNAVIHSPLLNTSRYGLSYDGNVHVTDWYPTIMGLATGGQWKRSKTYGGIDGEDIWDTINADTDSPHDTIYHYVGPIDASMQIGSLKYNYDSLALYQKKNKKPQFYFISDLDPSTSSIACDYPTLLDQDQVLRDDDNYILEDENITYYHSFFDMKIDPLQTTDYYSNSSYATIIADMKVMADNWQTQVVQTSQPDTYKKKSYWAAAGGISTWLEDDTDFVAAKTQQKYSYEDAPNIVFVLVDDWGWNDVGWRSTYMNWTTPNLDRLAAEGVKLDNYMSHASCVPSRSALMTGRFAIRTGLWSTGNTGELPDSEITIAQELKTAGYITYGVGKWHLGFSSPSKLPSNRGFDYFYGYWNGFIDYWDKSYSNYVDLHDNMDLETDENILDNSLHNGYVLQSRAEKVIHHHVANYPDSPMFLYYAMQLIHADWTAPQAFLDRCDYPDTESLSEYDETVLWNYCGMNVMVDEAVNNLTCLLESYDMTNNTILIVVSDNGGEVTIQGNNEPYRGSKGSWFRGGVQTTGFIHSKLISEEMKGQTYSGFLHITDWYPTLMGLATGGTWEGGLASQVIDGKDMWSAIMTSETVDHEIVHIANGVGVIALQYNDYLYISDDSLNDVPDFDTTQFSFDEDRAPDNVAFSCESPSLMSIGETTFTKDLADDFDGDDLVFAADDNYDDGDDDDDDDDASMDYVVDKMLKLLLLLGSLVMSILVYIFWRRSNYLENQHYVGINVEANAVTRSSERGKFGYNKISNVDES